MNIDVNTFNRILTKRKHIKYDQMVYEIIIDNLRMQTQLNNPKSINVVYQLIKNKEKTHMTLPPDA